MSSCVFCAIVAGTAPHTLVHAWSDAIAIVPLLPVTAGHVIVLPRIHVPDAGTDPVITGQVMARAAVLMGQLAAANLITSQGSAATQTIRHLHAHVVPRWHGDRLSLPWTPQQTP